MKILVVGATGQLGLSILDLEREANHSFHGLDRGELDLNNPEDLAQILDTVHPDGVVNAAAYTQVDAAESQSSEAYRVNGIAPGVFARISASAGIPFLHVSTDYVFDGTKEGCYKETDTPNPINSYGDSKLAGEYAVQENNIDAIILRTSWVFSRYGNNFLKSIKRNLEKKVPFKVVSDQHGTPTSARQIARVCLQLLSSGVRSQLLHFAGDCVVSWYEFAKMIENEIKELPSTSVSPCSTNEYPTIARRPLRTALSSEKIQGLIPVQEVDLAEEISLHLAQLSADSASTRNKVQ